MSTINTHELYVQYRPLLFSLAYQMTGSVVDAEDLVQDTFSTLAKVEINHISNVKAYLCKMITNRCIDYLKSAYKQRETYMGPWLPEPLLLDEKVDSPESILISKENISLAYLLLMEKLTVYERSVFLLREVFQLEYKEIADMVGKEEANCRKLFSRAKQKLGTLPTEDSLHYDQNLFLLEQFFQALAVGNQEKLLQLVASDVTLYSDGGGKVKAALRPIVSAARVIAFLHGVSKKVPPTLQATISNINGCPGLLLYDGDQLYSVISYHIVDNKMKEIYFILNPDKLQHIQKEWKFPV